MMTMIAVAAMVFLSFGALSSDADLCQASSDLHKEPVNVSSLADFANFPEQAVKDMGGKDNGVSWDGSTNTLHFNNTAISFSVKESYSSTGCCMVLPDDAKINLEGNNTIQFMFYSFPAHYLIFNNRPLDLTINGPGSLTLSTNDASQGTVDVIFGNIGRLVMNGCGLYYERTNTSSMMSFTDAETVAVINGANVSIKGSFSHGIFSDETINLIVVNSSVFLQNEFKIFDYSKEDRNVLFFGSAVKVSKVVTDDPQDDFDIADVGNYLTMKFTAIPGPESVPPGIVVVIALGIIAVAGVFVVRYR